jgi:hypothetical protein
MTAPAIRLALLAGLLALGATAARADSLTLQGPRLALTTTGDTGVTIETDGALHNAVRAIGDHLDCVTTQSGAEIVINTEECGDRLGHLTLTVPPGFGMTLAVQGNGDVTVGDVAGDLNAVLDSDGSLTVGSAHMLQLSVHGAGDATVNAVQGAADVQQTSSGAVKLPDIQGPLHARLSGSGDLTIGNINGPAADISQVGSGDVTIASGNIQVLQAQTHGNGDLTVNARVGTAASLQASGGGDIKLNGPTGTVLQHSASGGSDIYIGGRHGANIHTIPDLKGLTIDLSDDDGANTSSHYSSHGSHGFHDFVAGIVFLLVLFFIWRTVQRNGGLRAVRGRTTPTADTTHPGVIAVREALLRLDGRLSQVETYVTTREFDLQRKFRDLDRH